MKHPLQHFLLTSFLLFLCSGIILSQNRKEKYRISAGELEEWVSFLSSDEMKGRANGSPEMEEAAMWIAEKFKDFDIQAVYPDGELIRPYTFQTRKGIAIDERNIVGIIEGSDPALKDEYIIITAHFDHIGIGIPVDNDSIYNGADDNAAGTCTLLGIAKTIKENSLSPGRSILFASVSGEEMGLHGSKHLAQNMPLPLQKAYANINFEMTGHSEDLGRGNYYMTGCGFSNLDEVIQEFQPKNRHQLIDTVPQANRLFYMSDNVSFARIERDKEVSRGIPCGTLVTTTSGSHIHTPADEAGLFDFKNMASLVDYLADMVIWLSHSDQKIEWTDPRFTRIKPWAGQAPVKKVSTKSVPVQLQFKGIFNLGDGMYLSNKFEGARMNGVVRTNDTLVSVLITPENSPINPSPWYAFKLWSDHPRNIYLNISYPENAGHRYHPKLSKDGIKWLAMDTAGFRVRMEPVKDRLVKKDLTMKLSVGPDTLWLAAQELITNKDVDQWMKGLEEYTWVERDTIGESHEGRPLNLLRIGESDDLKMIMVLSRQHPPEVSGFLGMQAFVETLCADTELAQAFRKTYNTYVVPAVNPDGVYHGHWRHNRGGVDLNRDWESFNQPETSAVRDFMMQKTKENGSKFYFGVDFHSTMEDIYYTIDPGLKGNMPGLVPALIEATARELPEYIPNVKPGTADGARITSTSFLFFEFGAEAVTYEVGDQTSRDFIRRKAEVSAKKLMELMLREE